MVASADLGGCPSVGATAVNFFMFVKTPVAVLVLEGTAVNLFVCVKISVVVLVLGRTIVKR